MDGLTHPKFDLNDHLPHRSPIITSHRGLRYDTKQPVAHNGTTKMTKRISCTTSSASYNSESTFRKKDTKLESLQKHMKKLQ